MDVVELRGKRIAYSGNCKKLGVSAVGVGKASVGDRRSSDCSSGVTISAGDGEG